jgi:hypothetical protein
MAWSRAAGPGGRFTLFSLPFPALAQQATTRVDFGREVQPILRERCYGCHGPEQQMNGFRLDRRADALRGGTQTVIGPGNAEGRSSIGGSRTRERGVRMPPPARCRHEIAIIKAWIDQGVEWPGRTRRRTSVSAGGPGDRAADDTDPERGSRRRRRVPQGQPWFAARTRLGRHDAADGRSLVRRRRSDEAVAGDGGRPACVERVGGHGADVGASRHREDAAAARRGRRREYPV